MEENKITGYDLSRSWFDFAFENSDKINPNHAALYFFIIEHSNRMGWKQIFGLPSGIAMEAIGIKSYNTYIKTLNELIGFGFIKMIEKSKNQYTANIIALSKIDKALDKALNKALIMHTSKQSESTIQSIYSIIKQLNNKQINNKPKTKGDNENASISVPKDEFLNDCFNACKKYWLEEFHKGWKFNAAQGSALKAMIKNIKADIEKNETIGTVENITGMFKIICENLPEWYRDKNLNVINGAYNTIIEQIKNIKNGTDSSRKSSRNDVFATSIFARR